MQLSQKERIALATAMIEDDVNNTRMQDLVPDHPSDITKVLRGLVAKDLLETDNQRRWTRYRLPAAIVPRSDLFTPGAGDPSPLPADSSLLRGRSSLLIQQGEERRGAAAKVAAKGKVSKDEMEVAILELCRDRYLTLAELAEHLNRKAQNLRNKYLTPMVRAGKLRFRYPDQPNRTDQAYTAIDHRSD